MRRMALEWTLSRRQRVDFGAPPQTWEQYSKGDGIGIGILLTGEKMRKSMGSGEKSELLRYVFSKGTDT